MGSHPISALVGPIVRAYHGLETDEERAVAALATVATVAFDSMFWFGLAILLAANAQDYILGVRVAYRTPTPGGGNAFDGAKAFDGALSKVSGILLVIMIRALDWWIVEEGVLATTGVQGVARALLESGSVATLVTAGLILAELHSIVDKRTKLGGQPGWLLAGLEVIGRALHPARKELEEAENGGPQ